MKFIKQSFTNEENLKITKKFSKILKEFPDSKWKIKKLKSNNPSEEIYQIKDDKKIDISFSIPDKVLTGTKYDIDIILNEPLEEVIIAGGIKAHQVESFLEPEIDLEPLVSGGIYKMTRAPSKPGIQIWSGIIAHPKGIITFTKSIDIVEKI